MDENILLYQVKPGDTLDKIGDKIGMTGNQLKDFHNTHCGKMERLWFNNLVGVRQVIIPKEYKSAEQIRKEKETELPPSNVIREFYATGYTVKESFSDLSGEPLEIEYKIDVSFKRKQEINSPGEIINVKCYDFKKNGATPDDKMSTIALACMETIYPISLIIPFYGKISDIYHFEELNKRFERKRLELEEFFIGKVYHTYLNKFWMNLQNKNNFIKQLSSSLLYQTLFPRMEWFHKTNNWTQEFYLSQNSFPVKCSMNVEYNHEDPEFVQTLMLGHINDTFSLQEILRGKSIDDRSQDHADGQIAFRYITDKKTKTLNHADASVKFMNDHQLYRQQTLKLSRNE
jgi:hypothetical protein